MNKFITFTLIVCSAICLAHCSASHDQGDYGSLAKYANIDQYLNGASAASSSSASAATVSTGPAQVYTAPGYGDYSAPSSYKHAPSYGAPHYKAYTHDVAYTPDYKSDYEPKYSYGKPAYPQAPAYSHYLPAASHQYASHVPYPSGYRSYQPKLTVQPAYATQLYPGQQNYKAYQSPPQYSKVTLPIAPADPVAKLYVPKGGYESGYSATLGTEY